MATMIEASERQQEKNKAEVVLASETSILFGADAKRATHGSFSMPPAATQAANVSGSLGALLLPANLSLPPARRLVVLVPDCDVDESALAACIWSLATPRRLPVLLLGTQGRSQGPFSARRRLATLAAITRDDQVHVDSQIAAGGDWKQAVKQVWRPGDLVVCHKELTTTAGLQQRPLAQALFSSLMAPVYVISGFYPELASERGGWLMALRSFLPPIIVILGFFWLQGQVAQATEGGLQTILLILTVIVEFSLILAWEQFENHLY